MAMERGSRKRAQRRPLPCLSILVGRCSPQRLEGALPWLLLWINSCPPIYLSQPIANQPNGLVLLLVIIFGDILFS